MKLATHIHHVSGNCWKGFQGQMSKVKVIRTWGSACHRFFNRLYSWLYIPQHGVFGRLSANLLKIAGINWHCSAVFVLFWPTRAWRWSSSASQLPLKMSKLDDELAIDGDDNIDDVWIRRHTDDSDMTARALQLQRALLGLWATELDETDAIVGWTVRRSAGEL